MKCFCDVEETWAVSHSGCKVKRIEILCGRRHVIWRVIGLILLEYSLQITPELHYCLSIP
jgi:hypothetical protein